MKPFIESALPMIDTNQLTWKNIFYNEELDTFNRVLSVEYTEEAEYRNGYLIRDVLIDLRNEQEIRHQSIIFIPKTL